MDPALIFALAGTIFGGAGIKAIEGLLGRKKVKEDVATTIRAELRTEIKELRDRVDLQEGQLAEWRDKYYTLLDQFVNAKGELNFMMRRIKEMSDQGIIDWSEFGQGLDIDDK
jgi:hypothetical protein